MSRNLLFNKDFDVLIVEDEPILAMAMEMKLKKLGLNISGIATTPDTAIVHVQNNYPDIAIVDINLNSKKTGIDVANYIWKNFHIPIIFLTSYCNDKILNEAMESEPYAFLIKPCRSEALKAAISTAIHKHQFFFKNQKYLNPLEKKFVYLEKNIKFDTTQSELIIDEKIFNLTKNEKKLFEILTKEPGHVVSFNLIFNFVWREDVYDLSKLRSLIYRLKNRLGFNPFENLYEEGYRIKVFEENI